jgi:hypothetical protein
MSICRRGIALGFALALALAACGSSPEPCLRNSDCASNEYCSMGACLLSTASEGGVSGADGAAGSTTVMVPDVSTTAIMTPDASRAAVVDAASDGGEGAADARAEADVGAE